MLLELILNGPLSNRQKFNLILIKLTPVASVEHIFNSKESKRISNIQNLGPC